MVHSSRDQFCWIILCFSHFFLSRIVLRPQINLSETSFNSPYPLWYEGHLLWTSPNAPGWLLSLPSGGLSVWGRAQRLTFCRPLTVCSLGPERNSRISLYYTVSLWGSPGSLFLWRLLSLHKITKKLHCWETSQRTFPFIPVMDWQSDALTVA